MTPQRSEIDLKFRIANSAIAAVGTALALAAVYSGCGHEMTPSQGVTTVHFTGAQESIERARAMNLMTQLSSPEIFTAPTNASGGIMIMAQLVGGGAGSLFVPPNTGATWTLTNGTYNFSAVGYDGQGTSTMGYSSNGPYCGLALGSNGGQRGGGYTLAGTSVTVDILMGPTLVSIAGNGPSGSATQGFANGIPGGFPSGAPMSCGMSPFMPTDPATAGGCSTGTSTCFMNLISLIGFCSGGSGAPTNQGLPSSGDATFSTATNCANLNGPSGFTGSNPAAASGISSVLIQFIPFNNFALGTPTVPSLPLSTTGNLTSACLNISAGNVVSGIPLLPGGAGTLVQGGPAQFSAANTPLFGMMTTVSVFSDGACSAWKRTYFFPNGLFTTNGSTGTSFTYGNPYYIDSSAPTTVNSAAQTMAGFGINGNVPTTGKIWIQFP